MSSLTGGCSCNSSSSSNAFDIVLISLLKAVSEVNKNNNSYQSGDILDNIENSLETLNSTQNTNKVESSNKDESVNERIDKAISISSKK